MQQEPSSFRDPSGFVFSQDANIYRQVNKSYAETYDLFLQSGLCAALQDRGWLVAHEEVSGLTTANCYLTLQPEVIPFISYAYEWSFHQLKDAALLTLNIQKLALEYGLTLKDASAYNIQFIRGQPILIDTLSFDRYQEGLPWVAYRQFCQHFLNPLALMSRVDLRLGRNMLLDIDGISSELTSALLPKRTKLAIGLCAHIHWQSMGMRVANARPGTDGNVRISRVQLLGIISNLTTTIQGLQPIRKSTVWHGYYDNTNYTAAACSHKEQLIKQWIERLAPKKVWDAGANDARISQIASSKKIWTLATDIDPYAIDDAYVMHDPYLLPLIIDLANPTPAIGWENQERHSFLKRVSVDLVLALALIHHLAIGYNLPMERIAELFAKAGTYLIIEFVPKKDSKVQQLLSTRIDIFDQYTQAGFEKAFMHYFEIIEYQKINQSERIIYIMKRRNVLE